MKEAILVFHQDNAGEWVAQLACCTPSTFVTRARSVSRHRFSTTPDGRAGQFAAELPALRPDRAARRSAGCGEQEIWEEQTVPVALRRAHRLSADVWAGCRSSRAGSASGHNQPPLEVIVGPERPQAIPPDVEHRVEPVGEVRFFVELTQG